MQREKNLLISRIKKSITNGKYIEATKDLQELESKSINNSSNYYFIGIIYQDLKNYEKAIQYFLKLEELNGHDVKILKHLGSCYSITNNMEKAIQYYEKITTIEPGNVEVHYNIACEYIKIQQWNKAINSLTNAIEINSTFKEAYEKLTTCLLQIKAYEETINLCNFYIAKFGLNHLIIINKCRSLFEKGMKANAIIELEKYIEIQPGWFQLHTILAEFYKITKQYGKSIENFQKSIDINPKEFRNFNNIGNLYMEIGDVKLAIDAYLESIKLNPNSSTPYQNLAGIYIEQQEYVSALKYLDIVKQINPNNQYTFGLICQAKIYTCQWQDINKDFELINQKITNFSQISNPFTPIAYIDDQKLLTKLAADWVKIKFPESRFLPELKINKRNDKIRLGYFSADLHSHATALLMAGMLESHDKTKFELFAFSFGPDGNDEITRRVRNSFDHFIDVRKLSDRAIAVYARELNIDIAIDLKGFTQNSRPGIFAERAAPIQINYLGFPGSMGAPYIDYIIADEYIIPAGNEHLYVEKVVRMPHCYQPNDNKRQILEFKQNRSDHNLPLDSFVLCSFNNNYKITPEVFSIWMRLLTQFPNSVLWLLKDNSTAENNLRQEAKDRGVDPDRLVFAPRVTPAEHLSRHLCADLFVDTYPCNAHTTASDSLWSGLPLVTCSGNSFASRVAGSLLTTIGLPDLIAQNLTDYEQKIIAIMSNNDYLLNIKQRLRHQKIQSPLFKTQGFTRDFESLLIKILGN